MKYRENITVTSDTRDRVSGVRARCGLRAGEAARDPRAAPAVGIGSVVALDLFKGWTPVRVPENLLRMNNLEQPFLASGRFGPPIVERGPKHRVEEGENRFALCGIGGGHPTARQIVGRNRPVDVDRSLLAGRIPLVLRPPQKHPVVVGFELHEKLSFERKVWLQRILLVLRLRSG